MPSDIGSSPIHIRRPSSQRRIPRCSTTTGSRPPDDCSPSANRCGIHLPVITPTLDSPRAANGGATIQRRSSLQIRRKDPRGNIGIVSRVYTPREKSPIHGAGIQRGVGCRWLRLRLRLERTTTGETKSGNGRGERDAALGGDGKRGSRFRVEGDGCGGAGLEGGAMAGDGLFFAEGEA